MRRINNTHDQPETRLTRDFFVVGGSLAVKKINEKNFQVLLIQ